MERDERKETELVHVTAATIPKCFFGIIMQEIHHAFPIKYSCNFIHRRAVVFINSLVLVHFGTSTASYKCVMPSKFNSWQKILEYHT